MENNSRWLVIILATALALGVVVTALAPGYRRTAADIAAGQPEAAPIWRSNAGFYREVRLPGGKEAAPDAE